MGTTADRTEASGGGGTVPMRKEKPGVQPERLVKERGREARKGTGKSSGKGGWVGGAVDRGVSSRGVGGLTSGEGCEEGTCDVTSRSWLGLTSDRAPIAAAKAKVESERKLL